MSSNSKIEIKSSNNTSKNKEDKEKNPFHVNAHLILQTKTAKKLFRGKKKGPIGVFRFSSLVLRIWKAAAQDDPYADLFLVRIYDQITQIQQELQAVNKLFGEKLQNQYIEVKVAECKNPVRIPLSFATPYGFMAAYLLADFDRLVRYVMTVKYLGILKEGESEDIKIFRAKIQRLLAISFQWRYTGVTRNDLLHNNALAQRAKKIMGEINLPVFKKVIRSPHSPVD